MPWVVAAAGVAAAGSIVAGGMASDAQSKSAANAARVDEQKFQQIRGDLAPYREVGTSALTKYADSLGLNGEEARNRFASDFRADPGYNFAFDEGQRAIQGSAAARGGLLSGGALRALQRTGQGMADQQYGSYLDRFGNLANMGQNSAAQTGQFASQSAGRQGAYALDAGAAKAGGYLSAAQGVNGAISNGLQFYGQQRGMQPTYGGFDQSYSGTMPAGYFDPNTSWGL